METTNTFGKSRFPIQPTSVWRIDSVDAYWNIVENSKFFINGDTTVGSKQFFKLYKSGVAQYNTPFYYTNIYVGAIRDENNRIFFIKKNKTTELMLYDFNLKTGNTIKSLVNQGITIISINTLQNGRRIFYHNKDHYNLSLIIEGIGSNGGLFSSGSSFIILHSGEMANYLICYSEDDQLVYESEVGRISNCEIVNEDQKFPIDPTSIWRVDCDSNYCYASPHSERYQYYLNGDTLINQTYYFKIFKNNQSFDIDTHHLGNGNYLLLLNFGETFTTHKFQIVR